MIRFINDEGFVINKTDYGDADRYITVFTKNFGKINFFMKGIRKSKKREVGATDILTLSKLTFYRKKENYIISSLQCDDPYSEIKADLDNLGLALYIMSVLNSVLVENSRKNRLFIITQKTLEYLKRSNNKKNNYTLIAYYLYYIIKDEGLKIDKGDGNNFSFQDSIFLKKSEKFTFEITEEQKEIVVKIIEGKVKEILKGNYFVNDLLRVVLLLEKYLNFQFEISLQLKNYFMGVMND